MKFLALINPLHQLDFKTDTTFAVLQAAKLRSWEVGYFHINDLTFVDGEICADCYNLDGNFLKKQFLKEWDIIFFRQDPPVDLAYIYATQLLELLEPYGVRIVNNPQALRDFNEKLFILQFPQCIPETIVSANPVILKDFWIRHKKVIFKPLHGMAGLHIFYVDELGTNLPVILDTLTLNGTKHIMAQKYIPEILDQGDARILLIGGKPVDHVLVRVPKQGDIRGNMAAGATGKVRLLNVRERWLCEQIGPKLVDYGLDFVGIDVIGGYVTEINVTSPTCAVEIMDAVGEDIPDKFLAYLLLRGK